MQVVAADRDPGSPPDTIEGRRVHRAAVIVGDQPCARLGSDVRVEMRLELRQPIRRDRERATSCVGLRGAEHGPAAHWANERPLDADHRVQQVDVAALPVPVARSAIRFPESTPETAGRIARRSWSGARAGQARSRCRRGTRPAQKSFLRRVVSAGRRGSESRRY